MTDGKALVERPRLRFGKQVSSKYSFCAVGWKIGTRRAIQSREVDPWDQASPSARK